MLAIAAPIEPLFLYLSASDKAIDAALIKYAEGQQRPIYYISQFLKDAKMRYPNVQKFALALFMASRKFRHYFQEREIKVNTNQPLRKILHKPDLSRKLINWAVELSQFHITYMPRTAIKAQTLADFVVECAFSKPLPDEPSRLLEK